MPDSSKPPHSSRPSKRSHLPNSSRLTRQSSSSRTPHPARSSRPTYPAPTDVARSPDPTDRASDGVHRWNKQGKPATGPSTMGSKGPARRPRPKVFEFEISIRDGVTDEKGNKNSRQVTADFLLSVKGEKASEAHKKIVKQFACDLMKKNPTGQGKRRIWRDQECVRF
jgi:hypothetical protein